MKICILTPRFPFPENGGDVLRINHIAQYLKQQGHTLCLVSLAQSANPNVEHAMQLYDSVYFVKQPKILSYIFSFLYLLTGKPLQCGFYHSNAYLRLLCRVIKEEKPDLYISHLLRMTPYLEQLKLENQSVVEMTDALSRTYSMAEDSKANPMMRHIYHIERRRIKDYEAHVIATFPRVNLVSQYDVMYLKTFCEKGLQSLYVFPNGVDCIAQPFEQYNPKKICFVGNMRTLQNQDAVLKFIQQIFPLILRKVPDAKFHIIGAQVPTQIQTLASNNIIVEGYVENIADAIQDAGVAVAPIFVAAGIQNKVLISMACGLPIVLTSLIAYAIPELQNNINCRVEDEPVGIAAAVVDIMTHPDKRHLLAQAGYQMVKQHYIWAERLHGYCI